MQSSKLRDICWNEGPWALCQQLRVVLHHHSILHPAKIHLELGGVHTDDVEYQGCDQNIYRDEECWGGVLESLSTIYFITGQHTTLFSLQGILSVAQGCILACQADSWVRYWCEIHGWDTCLRLWDTCVTYLCNIFVWHTCVIYLRDDFNIIAMPDNCARCLFKLHF